MQPVKRLRLEEARGPSEIAENFRRIERYVDEAPPLPGFQAVVFTLNTGEDPSKIKHGLRSVPQDAVLTRLIAPSGVQLHLHFGLFDRETITVSASGPKGVAKVRLLIGSAPAFGEFQVLEETDIQTFTAGS